jgi:hypothetical protein
VSQDPSEIRIYKETLVGETGDSTCHLRDGKDSYIYYSARQPKTTIWLGQEPDFLRTNRVQIQTQEG